MESVVATRILEGHRRGSSRPVVVALEGERAPLLVKLRGAAQGTGALVAEVIVAELAEALGLHVPRRSIVELPSKIDGEGIDDELEDLLTASVGENLGFKLFAPARDLRADEAATLSVDAQAMILWLDRLTTNPDRTSHNPNLMWSREQLWLIDHGAALHAQYDWASVTEDVPRKPWIYPDLHLFETSVPQELLAGWDEILAARLTREVIEAAVAEVPDSFLAPLISPALDEVSAHAVARRRAAYAAFLWKRLKAPRPFLELRAEPGERPNRRPLRNRLGR